MWMSPQKQNWNDGKNGWKKNKMKRPLKDQWPLIYFKTWSMMRFRLLIPIKCFFQLGNIKLFHLHQSLHHPA